MWHRWVTILQVIYQNGISPADRTPFKNSSVQTDLRWSESSHGKLAESPLTIMVLGRQSTTEILKLWKRLAGQGKPWAFSGWLDRISVSLVGKQVVWLWVNRTSQWLFMLFLRATRASNREATRLLYFACKAPLRGCQQGGAWHPTNPGERMWKLTISTSKLFPSQQWSKVFLYKFLHVSSTYTMVVNFLRWFYHVLPPGWMVRCPRGLLLASSCQPIKPIFKNMTAKGETSCTRRTKVEDEHVLHGGVDDVVPWFLSFHFDILEARVGRRCGDIHWYRPRQLANGEKDEKNFWLPLLNDSTKVCLNCDESRAPILAEVDVSRRPACQLGRSNMFNWAVL